MKVCGGFSSWAATNDLEKETAFELWGQKRPEKQMGRKQLERWPKTGFSRGLAVREGEREYESYLKKCIFLKKKA